ncbi:MAG: universal stress protein [Deltaproteobacteria bacterium]|nr:universal stress protein [Deltaproteobacteria bacterium]MBW2658834.1 universal stress protein [Deltaproteobacteria bacterium]
MVKKILVPIAFSKYSQGILNYASGVAEPFGAELLVVNVINARDLEAVDKITSFGYKVDVEHYLATLKKERREELKKLMEPMTLPDKQVSFSFRVGDPTNELLKLVVDKNIDMVIMGIKTHDVRHIFAGSVAERMFRKCPVTILSYRDDEISERLLKKFTRHRRKETE